MDETDKRILAVLQRDAGLSVGEVAERAGLSKNPCWRRIRRLEDSGYITGRVALLDKDRLKLDLTVFIAVRTDKHTLDWLEAFKSAIRGIPEITGVYRTTGETDYLLQAVVPDMKAYDALYQRLISRIELSDVSSTFVMEEIKQTTELPLVYA